MTKITLRWVSMLFVAFFVFGSLIGSAAKAEEKVTWDCYSYLPPVYFTVKELKTFANDVKEKSGGRFEIRVLTGDETAYKGSEFLRLLRDGIAPLAEVSGSYISGDEPLLSGVVLPFLNSKRDYRTTLKMNDALGDLFDKTLAKWNAAVLGRFVYPEQNLWFAKPIGSIHELKGKKIRTQGPDSSAVYNALGAVGVTIASGELFTALQRGVIDGIMTAPISVLQLSFYEVVKQGWRTKVSYDTGFIMVSKKHWNTLSPDLQKVLTSCADRASERLRSYSEGKILEQTLQELRSKGVDIREVSDQDYEILAEKAKSAWYAWADRFPNGREALKKISGAAGRQLQ